MSLFKERQPTAPIIFGKLGFTRSSFKKQTAPMAWAIGAVIYYRTLLRNS